MYTYAILLTVFPPMAPGTGTLHSATASGSVGDGQAPPVQDYQEKDAQAPEKGTAWRSSVALGLHLFPCFPYPLFISLIRPVPFSCLLFPHPLLPPCSSWRRVPCLNPAEQRIRSQSRRAFDPSRGPTGHERAGLALPRPGGVGAVRRERARPLGRGDEGADGGLGPDLGPNCGPDHRGAQVGGRVRRGAGAMGREGVFIRRAGV